MRGSGMAVSQEEHLEELSKGYRFDWKDPSHSVFEPKRGLSTQVVEEISELKSEPDWMRKYRLKALKHFQSRPMPWWGADLSDIDFENIYYFIRSTEKQAKNWEELPDDIKGTWDKLGIPEAEKKYLGGVSAQYESEVVDNKFAALNSAVWSGGSFIYVPPGVHVDIPLQAYFRINAENMGQFERTLIIADEDSYVHYIEGCTAPTYTTNSLHSAVVELIAKPGARIRYSTIQNWSHNTYNLVTKRGVAHENATIEWVDGNLGSKLTMKYPAVYLVGEGARGEILSVAYAGDGQHQDAGGKVVHAAPNTSSLITSKSISKGTGRSTYRGLLKVHEGCHDSKSRVECDALLLDENARTDTYPYIEIEEKKVNTEHEATVSKVGEDQLFYLMSRGLSEEEAMAMVVNGFIEPIAKELPLEYAIELNRLIQLEMEGSVG